MSYHYSNLGQDSVRVDGLPDFESVIFGPSNTDQSYYEPIGTTISNMLRSGDISSVNTTNQLSDKELWNTVSLPQNMTREEISLYKHDAEQQAERLLSQLEFDANNLKNEIAISDSQVVQNSSVSE